METTRTKLRGVNLGSWLLLEKWMVPSLFEGLEALATDGFVPRRTVIVVSGHDEEAGGLGAAAAAYALANK